MTEEEKKAAEEAKSKISKLTIRQETSS